VASRSLPSPHLGYYNKMKKQNKTATEVMIQEEAVYLAKMNYLLAKALLTGKINSVIVRWAEEIVALHEAKPKK